MNRTSFCPDKSGLHNLLRHEFQGMRFIAVSNREPYIHQNRGDKIECIQPASGLADPPWTRSCAPPAVLGSLTGAGDADRSNGGRRDRVGGAAAETANTRCGVCGWTREERQYYYGLANEGLWPLCHIAFQRPTFRRCDWESYRRANEIFADAVLDEAGSDPAVVFIQDYHFATAAEDPAEVTTLT